jgi:hypothetical protein
MFGTAGIERLHTGDERCVCEESTRND